MKSLPKLCYLITFRESSENRTNALVYILQQLSSIVDLQVYLVEQDSEPRIEPLIEHLKTTNVSYLFVENSSLFNKSWGLNIAASQSTGDQLIIADADVLITESALTHIRSHLGTSADAINPYNNLIDLSIEETEQLIVGESQLDVSRSEQQLNRAELGHQLPFCGGVFAVTKELFETCGGMDERFEGWGGDDNAISSRLLHFSSSAITLNEEAYHLWHNKSQPTKEESEPYLRNLALLSTYYEQGNDFYTSIATADSRSNANLQKYVSRDSNLKDASHPHTPRPLISCLCVTRGRVTQLQRAVKCFVNQDYSNKELCLIVEEDDTETIRYAQQIDDPDIKLIIIRINPKMNLGELRNLSITKANGDYICQWDDDDWYHPSRLSDQLNCVLKNSKGASVLPRWLIYDETENQAYCSNIRLWEGSLLCRKTLLPKQGIYEACSKGEDTALIAWLYINDELAIVDRPELYVYHVTASNTWETSHFRKILAASQKLTPEQSASLRAKITLPHL